MADASRDGEAVPVTGPSLPRLLLRASAALAAVEKRVAAGAMIVLILAIAATIAVRILDLPLVSMGEIAVVAMSPLTFIGGAFCSHMHRHITIDLLELLPDGLIKTATRLAASLAMLTFAAIFAYLVWDLFSYALVSGERLIDLGTPVWIPVGAMFVGAALMAVHAVIDILLLLTTGAYGERT